MRGGTPQHCGPFLHLCMPGSAACEWPHVPTPLCGLSGSCTALLARFGAVTVVVDVVCVPVPWCGCVCVLVGTPGRVTTAACIAVAACSLGWIITHVQGEMHTHCRGWVNTFTPSHQNLRLYSYCCQQTSSQLSAPMAPSSPSHAAAHSLPSTSLVIHQRILLFVHTIWIHAARHQHALTPGSSLAHQTNLFTQGQLGMAWPLQQTNHSSPLHREHTSRLPQQLAQLPAACRASTTLQLLSEKPACLCRVCAPSLPSRFGWHQHKLQPRH